MRDMAMAVRSLSADMVCEANSGHLGLPLGMADCLTALFANHLVFDPEDPEWFNRDRFIMSGGHGSAGLYALLHLCGYKNFDKEAIKNFRKFGSITSGHPEYDQKSGIEMTTGPLGEGIASAVGFAIAEKILNNRLSCVNHFTYVCAGDGDLMEGVAHEACSIAGSLGLGKLIVLFDDNNVTIDGKVLTYSSEDVRQRFCSYGWQVINVDGHNINEVSNAIQMAKDTFDKPSILFCKTKIGYGSPFEGTPKAHCGIMSAEQLEAFKMAIEMPVEKFEIPEETRRKWLEIGKKHHKSYENWIAANGDVLANIEEEISSRVSRVIRDIKKDFFVSRPFSSTRAISGQIIDKMCAASKFIISGSCDLGKSTCCLTDSQKIITKDDFSGNYINYGIREHAMGAIINGITLHGGLKAFGGTFFAFSDYMRPAIRLSALMGIPSTFVFSHDSIGVGEDGPTHQPVEHLASFRAMPGINVFRPGDPLETLECWQSIMASKSPSILILSRQEVKSVRFCGRDNLCEKGAYKLYDDTTNCQKDVTIFATGSELGLAMEVRNTLAKKHSLAVDLISVPCFDIFDKSDEEYKKYIIGNAKIKVAIEAGCEFGWHKYIGHDGLFFGVNEFGKSANCSEIFNYFGLKSESVVNVILDRLLEK